MVEDELIVDLSEHISIRYGNIARFGKIKFTEEATNKINANPKDINIYNSLVPPNLGYSSDWSMKPANQAKNISTSIRSMIEKKNDSNNLSTGQMPVVSLNGLSVGVLDDEHGKRWGDSIKLNLEGFRYDQFESSEMSLASTYRENELKGFLKKEKEGLEKLIWPIIFIWKFISYKLASNSPVWKNRINWIKKQYDNNSVKSEDYRPQPFEQVANVFRKQGNHYYSSKVLVEKLRLERRTLYSIPKQFGLWIWDKFFGYGIFWGPTLKTFLLCWLIGWISVDIANNGYLKWPPLGSIGAPLSSSIYLSQPVLVIDATSVSTFALTDDAKGDDGNILAKEPVTLSPDGRYVKEIRCGDQIEPALYALDVFVPLLDLNQESKCTISSAHNAWPWRIGKSLYTILGWIVTSALILTITGVVRRQVER